ncbi:hypothetical protein CRE_07785 [Caenorhabditis remanei]|uniref:TIL domain-containing protein n=1 Tax=Caenorhabditis remanei TaxID=31234 RepID=E3NB80_CAERE|nr:hypothetical protein CRE_07785 [Caenorhabditis remanei]
MITVQITPCSTVRCVSGTECQELERNCTVPPCEIYAACVNTTVVDNLAGGCATMRCAAGETCEEAMVKCAVPPCPKNGMCVLDMTQNDTLNSCASVSCPVGESCEETVVQCFVAPCPKAVSCVPMTTVVDNLAGGCATMRCAVGETCEEAMVKCAVPPCPKHGMCVLDMTQNDTLNSCASVSCPVGESCEETVVQCFVAPWSVELHTPKAVSCVPMNIHQNSTARQGCDVVRCRANEICEEQEVQCVKSPCPIQVACVSIVHTNGTTGGSANNSTSTTNSTSPVIPPSSCPKNQTMSDCLNKCSEEKCPGIGVSMMCTKHCGQGCACSSGFVRSSDGECYKSKDCPLEQVCGENEEYRCEKCAGTCKNPEPSCPGPKNKSCNKKCICAAGFVRKNGKCVTLASCPDHDHSEITCLGTQDYTDCLPKCRQLCSGVTDCDKNMLTEMCTPGCVCRPNYKLDSNGTCVHNRHCFKTTDCPENEEWSKCVSDDNLCGMATIQKVPLRDQCFSGCICAAGFARNSNGTCVEKC